MLILLTDLPTAVWEGVQGDLAGYGRGGEAAGDAAAHG